MGHFMAYQRPIIKVHQSFVGEGWITYDSCYRQKAANIKSLEWGKVDFNLYNEIFTGRAKAMPHCVACPDVPNLADPQRGGPQHKSLDTVGHTGSVYGLFNSCQGNQCTYAPYCKFPHLCSTCAGCHPQSRCPHSSAKG